MSAAERTGDIALLAMHTANRGVQQMHSGDGSLAETDLELAVALVDSVPRSSFTPLPIAYLGVLQIEQGRLDRVEERLTRAVERADEAGNREVLGYARTQLLRLELLRDRPQTVVDELGPVLDLSGVTWWYDVMLATVLSTALLRTGRSRAALEAADQAVGRARRMRNRVDGVPALLARSRCLDQLGRAEDSARDRAEAATWSRIWLGRPQTTP